MISVEELGSLADLILPKSAMFAVEELSINRNEHNFDFVDNARVVSEFDDLFSQALSSTAFAEAAAEVASPSEEVPKPRFGFLQKLRPLRPEMEIGAPAVRPLLDISMRPREWKDQATR